MLELQKTAGNRAVGAAIARWGLPWIPMTAAPQWPKEPQVIADGMVLPLTSWSWADRTPGTGAGTGKPQEGGDISISTKTGEHSADLLLRTAEGRAFKTVVIVVPGKDGKGITLTLSDVMITGYQLNGDIGDLDGVVREEGVQRVAPAGAAAALAQSVSTAAFADQPPS